MPDEVVPEAISEAVQGAGTLRAPWLFWIELRNILIVGERRGRLPAGAAEEFLEAVDGLEIQLGTQTPSAGVLELARRHRLSAYDALYLELALRLALPLATLDAALGEAARAEGIHVFA